MELSKQFNTGLILGKRETDYILGSSPVVNEVLITDGNWKQWSPEHEIQAKRYYDTLSCVTYSALDAIEYIFTYRLNKGQVSPVDVKWLQDNGYFKNGYINFSERFTAILGGTTNQGAYQYKVGDAIRKFGLIPQDMFPTNDEIKTFEEYIDKTKITQAMYDLGLEFAKRFSINYQWAGDAKEALKYGPVQVCVYYLDGDGILCTDKNPIHAVTAVNSGTDFIEIDDSYQRQFKKYCHKAVYSMMLYTVKFNNMRLVKSSNSTNTTVFLIDALGNRRVFFNEKHFASVAPALGLAKQGTQTDWSNVELLTEEEINKFPLANPLYEVNG